MIQQRKIAKYVLLQIVTLGLYGLFFWSDWTEDLNKICEDDGKESANYILVFILDIFSFGIYSFAWNYIHSERMYRIAPKYGIELKHGGSYILLLRLVLFFLPVVGTIEKLKLFNTLAVAYNATLDESQILAAQQAAVPEKSKKELKKEQKALAKAQKEAEKAAKKNAAAAPVEEPIIPTPAGALPGLTDDTPVNVNVAPNAVVEIPVEEQSVVEAPAFEEIVVEEPVIEAAVEEAPVYEVEDNLPIFEEIAVEEPVIEVPVEETPVYEVEDNLPVFEEIVVEEPVKKAPAKKAASTKKSTKEKETTAKKEPAAKKTTKAKKEPAEKPAKTTKAKTPKAAPKEEILTDSVSFNDSIFEDIDLGLDILNEIAEISKSKK
jgi:hypothetical protein